MSVSTRSFRKLARVIATSFRLVWRAAPGDLMVALGLNAVASVGLGLQLLVGAHVVRHVLEASRLGSGSAALVPSLLWLAALFAVVTFAGRARSESQVLLNELTARYAQEKVIDVAVTVKLERFEQPAFYDELHRAQTAALTRPSSLAYDLMSFLGAGMSIVGLIVALGALQPILLPIVVLAYVPLWVATGRNSRTTYRFGWSMTPGDRQRSYLSVLLTGKAGAQEVRAFDVAPYLRRRFDSLYDTRIAEVREVVRIRLRRTLIASVATSALSACSFGALVFLLVSGRMPVSSAAVAAVGIQQLGGRLGALAASSGRLYEHSLFLNDLMSFIGGAHEDGEVSSDERVQDRIDRPVQRVEFRQVSFTYPDTDRRVLDDISCELRRGEVVALVGENGSGKTTFAKLLSQLYQPSAGRIVWDNGVVEEDRAAVADYEGAAAQRRQRIAILFQDFVQYYLSAYENIAVGDHERASLADAIVRAAEEAGAHQIIASLPEAYRTLLGREFDGGAELSVGQWQRIALARALFRDAPIVVLDEPTASLDARAEHELFDRMRSLTAGRIVLLISHRFSSVRTADRILVLRDGRLIEEGTHHELIAAAGHYAELFNLQAEAYRVEAEA